MNKRPLTLLMYGLIYGLPLVSLLFGFLYPDDAAVVSRGAGILFAGTTLTYVLLRNRYMSRYDAASARGFIRINRLAMLGLVTLVGSLWVWIYPAYLSNEPALMAAAILAATASMVKFQLMLPKWLNTTFETEAQSADLETDDL